MAAKSAFSFAGSKVLVSEDWVVGTTGIEPVTPTMSTKVLRPKTYFAQTLTVPFTAEHR
jgi:hypothetical protein